MRCSNSSNISGTDRFLKWPESTPEWDCQAFLLKIPVSRLRTRSFFTDPTHHRPLINCWPRRYCAPPPTTFFLLFLFVSVCVCSSSFSFLSIYHLYLLVNTKRWYWFLPAIPAESVRVPTATRARPALLIHPEWAPLGQTFKYINTGLTNFWYLFFCFCFCSLLFHSTLMKRNRVFNWFFRDYIIRRRCSLIGRPATAATWWWSTRGRTQFRRPTRKATTKERPSPSTHSSRWSNTRRRRRPPDKVRAPAAPTNSTGPTIRHQLVSRIQLILTFFVFKFLNLNQQNRRNTKRWDAVAN